MIFFNILYFFYFSVFRTCQPGDFYCTMGNNHSKPFCIPKEKRCDGYIDCRNGRDEEGCFSPPTLSCTLDKFRCAKGHRCIDASAKCNHRNDCGDNSDEENCSK